MLKEHLLQHLLFYYRCAEGLSFRLGSLTSFGSSNNNIDLLWSFKAVRTLIIMLTMMLNNDVTSRVLSTANK